MTITHLDPAGLPSIDVYRQVAIATGSKLVFIAGQVDWDASEGTLGEGAFAHQVGQCYLNIRTALAELGATFNDVAKLTVYVVDWTPDKMPALLEGIRQASVDMGITPIAPVTLIGVAALSAPEHLVEVEATAVLS